MIAYTPHLTAIAYTIGLVLCYVVGLIAGLLAAKAERK